MFLSVFDMFKVGIGRHRPYDGSDGGGCAFSRPAARFAFCAHGLRGSLHGRWRLPASAMPLTATILGLAGFLPDTYDHAKAEAALAAIRETGQVHQRGLARWPSSPRNDLIFDYRPNLPGHANGMILMATDAQGDVILQETY